MCCGLFRFDWQRLPTFTYKYHRVADWLFHGTFVISSFQTEPCTLQTTEDKNRKTQTLWSDISKTAGHWLGQKRACINFIWGSVIHLFICHCIITHRKNDPDLYACDLCLLVIFWWHTGQIEVYRRQRCIIFGAKNSNVACCSAASWF